MLLHMDELVFQVLTVEQFSHKKGVFDVKARPFAALSLRVSGTGYFTVMQQKFVSGPGEVLFIPQNTPYRVEYSGGESIVAHLLDCNCPAAGNYAPASSTAMEAEFTRMLEDWGEKHAAHLTKAQIYQALYHLAADGDLKRRSPELLSCVHYMEQHYTRHDLKMDEISRQAFISVSGMQRLFRQHFGVSPGQYLSRLRLRKALEMLREGKMTVRQVANACGFADEKYFSRVFRGKYGCPPSRFFKEI